MVRSGRRAGTRHLVVHLLGTGRPTPPRAGFVVSGKVGNSVVRHRVTRRLRPLVRRELVGLAAGTDVVVRALPAAATASSVDLGRDLRSGLAAAERKRAVGILGEPQADPMTSLPAQLLIAPIRFYQRFITPYTPATCRYYPTCSAYAVTALRTHGAVIGTGLTIWRLLRCNPWSSGGIDHVPAKGQLRHRHAAC